MTNDDKAIVMDIKITILTASENNKLAILDIHE